MPQELQVLKCYNCSMFQVDIVKKIAKWQCKMCGEKQSVLKVYKRGAGKDCRLMVQKLNETCLTQQSNSDSYETSLNSPQKIAKEKEESSCSSTSKWDYFLSSHESTEAEVKPIIKKMKLNDDDIVSNELLESLFGSCEPADTKESPLKRKHKEITTEKKNSIFQCKDEPLDDLLNFE